MFPQGAPVVSESLAALMLVHPFFEGPCCGSDIDLGAVSACGFVYHVSHVAG